MRKMINATNISLALIFLIYCVFIIFQTINDADGFITSDSAHYLQLAQNILNGNGLSTANYVADMSTYFATWPIGYSLLIAGVSFVSSISVVWAAKVVNMICLFFSLVLLKRLFGRRSATVALVFFVSTFTAMFVYTWSEVPFLLGMLWLVFGLARYIQTEKLGYAVHLFLAALFLFFMRYIGLIGGGIIGLVGFYYLFRKQWVQMFTLWITGSLTFVVAGLYLAKNYSKTGLMTGMERIPRKETTGEFITMLKEAVVSEINLFSVEIDAPVGLMIIVMIAALLVFIRPTNLGDLFTIEKKDMLLPLMFLFVGVVYSVGIVYMRATAYFDSFDFRLLGPATFMFVLFLVSWIAAVGKRSWMSWQLALVAVLLTGFFVNMVLPMYELSTSEVPTYKETVADVQADYDEIPEDSIVAFETVHARYLRPDLQFVKVHFKPYFAEPESVAEFTERISPNSATGVYFQEKSLVGYDYDESFVEMMEQAEKENIDFIELDEVK